jgi:hypothetical protein
VLDLAAAGGRVIGLEAVARLRGERVDDLEHAGLDAAADVVRAGGVRVDRAQVGVDDVAHVHVVARLLAVAEDLGSPALQQRAAEDRDHPGLAERVLAGAVDVAVAQRDRRQPMQAREQRAVVLGAELGQAIGGLGRDRVVLGRGEGLALAVDRPAG